MSDTKASKRCFNCNTPENQIPLINLSYAGNTLLICPQCMPKLIHQPEVVIGKLPKSNGNFAESDQ